MKTIIAGSRGIEDLDTILEIIMDAEDHSIKITEVVSGTARGVDRLGEEAAELMDLPVKKFPANWNKFGKSAGYKRNSQMADYADALIAIWDGKSKGTKHMIDLAKKAGLTVVVYIVDNEGNFNAQICTK